MSGVWSSIQEMANLPPTWFLQVTWGRKLVLTLFHREGTVLKINVVMQKKQTKTNKKNHTKKQNKEKKSKTQMRTHTHTHIYNHTHIGSIKYLSPSLFL